MTELLGYAASALAAVSPLTSNVLRLRVLNLAGAAGPAARRRHTREEGIFQEDDTGLTGA